MSLIGSSDFPFTIMDAASLLGLNIRRKGEDRVAYADGPFCGDRRGRLALYHKLDTWRCWHCGEHGGMLLLYGKSYGVSNSEAYRKICDILAVGGFSPAPAYQIKEPTHQTAPSARA